MNSLNHQKWPLKKEGGKKKKGRWGPGSPFIRRNGPLSKDFKEKVGKGKKRGDRGKGLRCPLSSNSQKKKGSGGGRN